MEKSVIFRDRQEAQAADFNNFQKFANDSMKHIVADGITDGRRFTGFATVASTDTEITVAPGRVYQGGDVYTLEQSTVFNMFQYLTVATKRVVALVAYGAAIETDTQPRDFLIDITSGATEPQAVPMQGWKKANLNLVAGVESADPVAPSIGENTVLIALITMSTTKVDNIQFIEGNTLPNAEDNERGLANLNSWRAQIAPQVDSINTQIAALKVMANNKVDRPVFRTIAQDLALIKDLLKVPEGAIAYASDRFDDTTKTDTNLSAAVIDVGLQFPKAAEDDLALQLFNPFEERVKRTATDFVLPAYTEESKIVLDGYAGDIALSQYQVTTYETKKVAVTTQQVNYGISYTSDYWYRVWDAAVTGRNSIQLQNVGWYEKFAGISYDSYVTTSTSYEYVETEVTVSYDGAMVAQTILAPNSFWLTSIDVFMTAVAANGAITVGICDVASGEPNLKRTIATVTVNAADLKKYPAATNIQFPPVWIEAGKRYAVFFVTTGAHRIATVSAKTIGTLFYSTDQAWFSGDLTKDLMINLNGAAFKQARTEVQLQSLSLAGGITDIQIETQTLIPDGTELSYEIQVGGVWSKLSDGDKISTAKPDLIPLRVVFIGTRDAMPGLQLGADKVNVFRAATSMTHVSTLRTLPSSSSNITVTLDALRFDAPTNTLACTLVDNAGANPVSPSLTETQVLDAPDGTKITRKIFTFTPSARTTYKIKTAGTRTTGGKPFTVIQRTDVAE